MLQLIEKKMFNEFDRIIKDGGTIACFGQNATYTEMIQSNIKNFKYELVWVKNNAAQGFHVDKMPLIFTENIAIFIHNERKGHKRTYNNIAKEKSINKKHHFCRWYSQQLFKYIGKSRRKIHSRFGHRKLEFFFYYTGSNFGLLSKKLYQDLINEYKIHKWKDFISYKELKSKWNEEAHRTKGKKFDSSIYSKTFNNILSIPKETKYFHPTQKPVKLIEKLILMYTNKGDKVLDCFMGSGSTGIAAVKNKREFLGCELDKKYYKIARERINKETL